MNEQIIKTIWSQLHWLSVLAEQGSYTAAAARLGVSKAAVSQQITDLERSAGVALVRRTTRSMRLTEAGRQLVDATSASFEQIARSFAEVQDQTGAPRGLLRITAPVAFARQQLVPRLSDFLNTYPDIRLELDMSDRLSSLVTEGFDVAIRHTELPPDTHVAWTLCRTRSVLVASSSYLERFGAPINPEELMTHSCLFYPRSQYTPAWSFEPNHSKSAGKRVTVPVSGALGANNSEALRDAALAGLGIALLPDFTVQNSIRDGRLTQVLPKWKPVGAFAEHLYAIRPYSVQVPRAVTAFVNYLREALSDGFGEGIQ